MKLAPLLVAYLSQTKRLALPSIGTFSLAPAAQPEPDHKSKSAPAAETIRFECDLAAQPDEGLIDFISSQTGKMRILAESDLSSYMELMHQFLNIGKSFHIEGIGTLIKNKSGQFEFLAGQLTSERLKESGIREAAPTSNTEESFTGYKELLTHHEKPGLTLKKTLVALLFFGGIGLAIWGGYALYRKNKAPREANEQPVRPAAGETQAVTDSTLLKKVLSDTTGSSRPLPAPTQPVVHADSLVTFVFETTQNKARALRRYNFLKTVNPAVGLATADSITFQIYLRLKVQAADTLHLKDSLNAWYYGKDRSKWQVAIQQ
ncbi:MAG TPA: hypothetical protein VG870_15405 [Chitinophagaceae bacterium]|nr:hypothetical protein [Chitinophagaceae bacterium]